MTISMTRSIHGTVSSSPLMMIQKLAGLVGTCSDHTMQTFSRWQWKENIGLKTTGGIINEWKEFDKN